MSSNRFRSTLLALGAFSMLAAGGCRTAGVDRLARPSPLPPSVSTTAYQLLADHNRNAERIESIEATPAVTLTGGGTSGGADGKLHVERPRNFKLVLRAALTEVANVGSNDDEFWIWFKDRSTKEKAIYYCNYDESGESPLSTTLQPQWILEALGLRVVSEEEAKKIRVSRGSDPGTLVLSEVVKTAGGESLLKETVLSATNRRIVEQRIYTSDKRTLLAHAEAKAGFQDYPIASTEPGKAIETVYLPKKIRLEWTQEKMAIEVNLVAGSGLRVNNKLSEERRRHVFVEPKIPGIGRINLADRTSTGDGAANSRTPAETTRESLPSTPPRVRLVTPSPLETDGARRPAPQNTRTAADLLPSYARGVEQVVGPPIPTIAEPAPEFVQAHTGWRNALTPAVER